MKVSALLTLTIMSVSLLSVVGCGPGEADKPVSIASDARVNEIVQMRKIFDEAKGNWDALPPEKKAEYTKLAGDEEKAKTMWANMVNPMGANAGAR